MSRFIRLRQIADPFVLDLVDRDEPHAGPGQVRVRVAAAGLNPVDWKVAAIPEIADRYGVSAPTGFGNDYSGTVDEVGAGVEGFAVGDRVYGAARGRALADHLLADVGTDLLERTPEALSDELAAALPIIGRTAAATVAAVAIAPGETVLIGGAAGGVGVVAVPLALRAGASVIATASVDNHDFLRQRGAVPTTYGVGLADRVRELAPHGVDAAIDLQGVETLHAALARGVAPARIATIAAGPHPPGGAVAVGAVDADPRALGLIAHAVAAGEISIPVHATFPLEGAAEAVDLLRTGHVRGKVIIAIGDRR